MITQEQLWDFLTAKEEFDLHLRIGNERSYSYI